VSHVEVSVSLRLSVSGQASNWDANIPMGCANYIIADLDLKLDIPYNHSGELEITLTHPDGATVAMIVYIICGGTENIVEVFDDDASIDTQNA
jgi:subtilisin-like proprotein convertase family protein